MRQEYAVWVRNRFVVLPDEGVQDAEAQWSKLQEAMNGATDKVIPNTRREMRQEWMAGEILQKMNRRTLKNNKTPKYRAMDKEIKQHCIRAKFRWLNEQCEEVERLEKIDNQGVHNKIKKNDREIKEEDWVHNKKEKWRYCNRKI